MKHEEWTFGGVIAAVVFGGLALWFGSWAVLGSCGCKGVDPNQIAERIQDELPDKPADTPAVASDELAADSIGAWHDVSVSPKSWPVTHQLKATLKGGKITLESDALSDWPDGGGRVAANLHFIVQRQGKWLAYCFDYVRPGQTIKGDLPRAPCKPGESYETVDRAEVCYLVLTGLCRDKRRNVSERTNIVRVQ